MAVLEVFLILFGWLVFFSLLTFLVNLHLKGSGPIKWLVPKGDIQIWKPPKKKA